VDTPLEPRASARLGDQITFHFFLTTMSKPICVVLDTNIWRARKFLLLNTPLAAALLFSLQRKGGVVGMPEVLELEILKQLGNLIVEEARRFEDAAAVLSDLGVPTYSGPPFSEEALRASIRKRLDDFGSTLLRLPLSLEQARRALNRINSDLPPNGHKNQQFKDSALWEAIREFGSSYDVVFATADKGFFDQRDSRRGLAANLQKDISDRQVQIRVFHEDKIEELLGLLQDGLPTIDPTHISSLLLDGIQDRARESARTRGYTLGPLTSTGVVAFLTSRRDTLTVSFRFRYKITGDRPSQEGVLGEYAIDGMCYYNISQSVVDEVEITYEGIKWEYPGGFLDAQSWVPIQATGPQKERGPMISWT
jgi:hypothetical protein